MVSSSEKGRGRGKPDGAELRRGEVGRVDFVRKFSKLIINMCNMYVSKCKHNAWQDWQESEQRKQGCNNFTIVLNLSC